RLHACPPHNGVGRSDFPGFHSSRVALEIAIGPRRGYRQVVPSVTPGKSMDDGHPAAASKLARLGRRLIGSIPNYDINRPVRIIHQCQCDVAGKAVGRRFIPERNANGRIIGVSDKLPEETVRAIDLEAVSFAIEVLQLPGIRKTVAGNYRVRSRVDFRFGVYE